MVRSRNEGLARRCLPILAALARQQRVCAATSTPASDLPVERPVGFEPVAQLRASRGLGAKIVPGVLNRADRVTR